MENLEIKDRILKILNTENMSSAKFADLISVQRSNISHILSGRNNPGLDFLQKVLIKFPLLNPDWLLIGKGEMYRQNRQTEINFDTRKENTEPQRQKETVETVQQIKEIQVQTIVQKPKSIKQVVVFYDDNSFEILNPEKKEKQPENE